MAEDITIGISIFIAFVVLAMIGRKLNVTHIDIWSSQA